MMCPCLLGAPIEAGDAFFFELENTLELWGMGNDLATVDGQNPAPPRMMIIPLFIGF